MTIERTVEDRLREEYVSLLPSIRRATDEIEAEARYLLRPVARDLEPHERLVIRCRVKECESAIAALERRREYSSFRSAPPADLTLRSLNDLAGLRILAFPKQRVAQCDELVRARFAEWIADPVSGGRSSSEILALKYHGLCSPHSAVRSEIQVLSLLIGLFWEVEHGALYKPSPRLVAEVKHEVLQARNDDVIDALLAFEHAFEAVSAPMKRETSTEESS
jgi:ppGpp synthetase/RelA/SpoT-type nucleotidyltranferase